MGIFAPVSFMFYFSLLVTPIAWSVTQPTPTNCPNHCQPFMDFSSASNLKTADYNIQKESTHHLHFHVLTKSANRLIPVDIQHGDHLVETIFPLWPHLF